MGWSDAPRWSLFVYDRNEFPVFMYVDCFANSAVGSHAALVVLLVPQAQTYPIESGSKFMSANSDLGFEKMLGSLKMDSRLLDLLIDW